MFAPRHAPKLEPCLGDAVQRWLRHPEPSSSSLKSTIKKKLLLLLRLGDAVQRGLRRPELSSWSRKSTIKKKLLLLLFFTEKHAKRINDKK